MPQPANDQPPNTAISEQFIKNEGQEPEDRNLWVAKDGIDIYFDGCRHLPDNCTITRLVVQVLDADLKTQHPKSLFLAIID